jgi:hypothetical protein
LPSFEHDIKPLFRLRDRNAMSYRLDLWSYDDVQADAQNILDRIEDGTMPCDYPWPEERIGLYRAWLEEGCPP